MRRLFVVFALLAMMVGLKALKTDNAGGADPITLAAIGFVVLAAFALAELGSRLSLPKVTGYILSGVALGPFAVDILSKTVVVELKMFSTLALGLIATTAGLELDLKALARLTRTLGATIGVKLVAGLLLVGGALVVFELGTGILGLPDTTATIAMALVFGALSLGTSPAIALAVQSESGAKGRLTEIVLGAAVVKDVVVVVSLAMALAVSKALLGGGGLGVDVLVHLGEELGASVLAGAILGGILIAYLRWVKTEMLLFVAAMVLVVAEISEVLHLELLLVFIVAGVSVRNFSPFEHDLLHPLETISLPVFIVFFTNAGASIDLAATWSLLPLALVLCGARAAGYFVAARVGGAAGGESDAVRRLAWLGYLPQAGVTLGLVGLAAGSLPELGTTIAALGMAVVAVNLLVGPVTLRMALQGAGETADARGASTADEEEDASPEAVAELPEELEAPVLRSLLAELREELSAPWAHWREEQLAPAVTRWRKSISPPTDGRTSDHGAASVLRGLDRVDLEELSDRAEVLRGLLARQLEHLEALPPAIEVALEERNAEVAADDGWRARWIKRSTALGALLSGRRSRRRRRVPVRITARAVLEPAMTRLAEESLHDWQRYEIECLETLERVALRTSRWEEVEAELSARRDLVLEKVAANHEATLWAATRELGRRLAVLGAPGARARRRYSAVERELAASVRRLEDDARAWPSRRRAAVDRLRFNAETELVEHRVCARLQQEVVDPLDVAFERVGVLVEEQRRRLASLPRAADLGDDDAWSRAAAQIRAVLPKPAAKELRTLATRVRRATSSDNAGAELRSFVADGDEQITVVASLEALARAPRPATVEVVGVNARELKEVQLAGRVLPLIEECLGDAAAAFAATRDQMREVVNLAEFGFEAAARARGEEGGSVTQLDEALERGQAMLEAIQASAARSWQEGRARLIDAVSGLAEQLSDMVTATAGGDHGTAAAQLGRFERLRVRARLWQRRSTEALRRLLHALQTGEVGQAAEDLALRYRLRAGLERFDAHAIRSFLGEQLTQRRGRLEGLHASLFSGEPLRDPRLFVANRDALGAIVRAERAWQSDPAHGNGALVVGPSGTGKSSTLGIAQLKLGTRRVVSVRPIAEGTTLRSALAAALGVADEEDAVLHALRSSASIVVIDDLQRYFSPTADGLEQMEAFITRVVATRSHAFWLVATAEESLMAWQGLVALDEAFPCRVHLQPLDLPTLAAVIEARRELGGHRCVYPAPRGAWLAKLMRRSPQDTYMRRLGAVAGGSLRRAMDLWRAHAELVDDALRLRPIVALSWRLPFVQQMRPEAQAILTLLVRHGDQPHVAIAAGLGMDDEAIEVHLRFLIATGLVEERLGALGIKEFIKDDLVAALRETGSVGGGG
ncbi:MAG: cation:proton antiporter [Myxococcales bacterium]|nr:cation:proton antiporter [Myxococcales bacterium]MCB9715992.1 cation:proton antiporter [Myxococcales bacterium]